MTALLVALGSALGGVCRYGVFRLLNGSGGFPWGTFSVNVLGSLAIGCLCGILSRWTGHASAVRSFAVVGFCGGFTTFSTFSNEAVRLMESAQWGLFLLYVLGSVAAGIAAVWLGLKLG